jgi:hypothetical protein
MSSNAVNPYEPPPVVENSADKTDDGVVHFYNTDANLRFAESHFVLRLHPLRLIIVSLALIAASSVVMIVSCMLGAFIVGVSSIVAMIVSALIYLASVYRSKLRLREQWNRYGLQAGTVCSVETTEDDLVLKSPAGMYQWPIDSFKAYRTRKGLMLAPEPMLCLFVPKKNQSAAAVYDELRVRLGK